MRVVVIGGSGHIGTFLVPRLVRAGHEVISISRGTSAVYSEAPEWEQVRHVAADREAEDAAGTFGDRIVGLKPDAVVDLVCFTLDSAQALVDRLRGEVGHLVHCGSIWRSGVSAVVPTTEETMTPPFGEYGVQKDRIARMLKAETADGGLATTSLHPGHIVGPGWAPIGPLGNLDLGVWQTLSAGRTLHIPGLGAESVHHVHADDVAQAFEIAVAKRDAAAGEDFTVTSLAALTVRGFAHAAAGWFGQEAVLEHVSWDDYRRTTTPTLADHSWEHLERSPCFSIDKARRVLGYAPSYSSLEAVRESVGWLIENGKLRVERPLVA